MKSQVLLASMMAAFLLIVIGCGREMAVTSKMDRAVAGAVMASPNLMPPGEEGERGEWMETSASSGMVQQQPAERKIIYTADVSLVVDNFDGLEDTIRQTVRQHGGYLAEANLDRLQGESRRGRWRARIPVARYEDFLQAVSAIGVPTSLEQSAEDVTEEFVDLNARLDNKRKLETRILELLDRPDDEIKHVIEVERELARVREEIERMEGRLRFLSDQTAMTTVTINAREERNYQPPQAPTLDNRVYNAWNNSLENTGRFFQDALVWLVGHAIPLVAWIAGILISLLVFRLAWRKWRGGRSRYEV